MGTRTPPLGWTPAADDTATVELVGLRDHLYLVHWLLVSSEYDLNAVHDALHDERTSHERAATSDAPPPPTAGAVGPETAGR